MAKTANDVVTAAYRRIGVAAVDVPLDADNYAVGLEIWNTLQAELYGKEGISALASADSTPDWAFNAVVQMLAIELAPMHGLPKPETDWFQQLRRLRRGNHEDDREDLAGLNLEAYDRAAFY